VFSLLNALKNLPLIPQFYLICVNYFILCREVPDEEEQTSGPAFPAIQLAN
jgi:hypothetical protein